MFDPWPEFVICFIRAIREIRGSFEDGEVQLSALGFLRGWGVRPSLQGRPIANPRPIRHNGRQINEITIPEASKV